MKGIVVKEGDIITDDELKALLSSVGYGTLIFATQQCMGGGLIDDISAPGRIIMTAIDETHLAVADSKPAGTDGFSEWSAAFFDALHGENTNYTAGQVAHTGEIINADANKDGRVSMLEAFKYASVYMKNNVTPFLPNQYPKTPWLDDDGDRLPTFVNQSDIGNEIDDGTLAAATFFPLRHYNLTIRTCDIDGQEFSSAEIWIDGKLVGASPRVENVSSGHIWHNITVKPNFFIGHNNYTFSHWDDNSTSNSRLVHLDSNMTITAYYTSLH